MTPTQFLQTYETALATQEWQAVAPLIHDDACVTFSNGTFKGKSAVREAFERNFGLIQDETYSIRDIHWVKQAEEYAVCLYTFHWQGTINGQPASGSGRGTSVLVRDDGKWLLLVEHLGPDAT